MTLTYHLRDIDEVANKILSYSKNKIFILNAPMGAGKTTLITAMCKKLGVIDKMSSPTFSIVNEYNLENQSVFHFDLYRVENAEELFDIGIEDYIQSESYIFVEWPDLLTPYLQGFTELRIEPLDETTRKIEII